VDDDGSKDDTQQVASSARPTILYKASHWKSLTTKQIDRIM